jgi:hypothetical protein
MKQNHNSAPPIQPAAAVTVADQLKRALRQLCLLATSAADAASTAWNGGGGADLNWSTGANWINGALAATTDVFFGTNAASAFPGTPNNIVGANRTITRATLSTVVRHF